MTSADDQILLLSKGTRFDLPATQLDVLANRLWKTYAPDRFDFVYGRIWLHANQVSRRFNETSITDILAGLTFYSGTILSTGWRSGKHTGSQVSHKYSFLTSTTK